MVKITKTKAWLLVIGIILSVLIIDQFLKIYIKTHLCLGESIKFANWAYLYFVENEGMAFGWDVVGTMFLCLFRIIAVIVLCYYIAKLIKNKVNIGFLVCIAMIVAGAFGNIIDNMFYGLIFTESSHYQISYLVPWGYGYGSFFSGKVVDMFYFPIIDCYLPSWLPLWGDNHFVFFSPIFNFADASISCAVIIILLFYRKLFKDSINKQKVINEE